MPQREGGGDALTVGAGTRHAGRTGRERVALVVPYGELTLLPSVVNSAEVLANHGYDVDVIGTASARFLEVPPHRFENSAVRVIWHQPGRLARLKGIGFLLGIWGLYRTVWEVCRRGGYRCLFGVDAEGLIAATLVARRLRLPVIYHSLEFELSKGETQLFLRALRRRESPLPVLLRRFLRNRVSALLKKPMERWAHRRAVLTLAPDDVRAQALLEDNGVLAAEVLITPPSPLALRKEPDRQFLRQRFSLDPGRKLLLQLGGISDVARSLELAQAARHWPENWTLILHGFAADAGYLARVRSLADGRRVIVSTEMVPYSDLDDLVASADIGLALYRAIDLNYVHMASGKLLQYLKCAVPVIATDFPNLRRVLVPNGCGVCVAREEEIVPAAHRILGDPGQWAANAQRCFREQYDFGLHFARVVERIGRL